MKSKHLSQLTETLLVELLLFSMLFSPFTISYADNGATWIPFIPGAAPGTQSQVQPKSGDTMGLCIDSSFTGMYRLTTYINDTRYDVLHVPGAGHAAKIGEPALPKMTRLVELPDGVDVGIEIIYTDMKVLDGYYVIPAQEPSVDYVNATEPPFTISESAYRTDAFYPIEIASLTGEDGLDPAIIRGHRIAVLSLFPVQFNPVTQQIRVYSKIEVRLNYDKPAQVGPLDQRLTSPAFESLLDALVLNYQPRPPPIKEYKPILLPASDFNAVGNDGCDYLIITFDDFYKAARKLAVWKEKKGLDTIIVNTTQIRATGLTANDVETYVQNAYDTWSTAPTYILLLGDSEHIPPHYITPHPSIRHGGFDIPTDLYFAAVEGNDYFQDIYIGRLSVNNLAQAYTIVNKILDYERNPPNNADFYNQVTACAQFQDETPAQGGSGRDGFEDRRFVLTSEEIRDYLNQTEGYFVDRVYWARNPDPAQIGGQDPTNYNNGPYDNGNALPQDLLWPAFRWDGDAQDVTDNITDGRFLIYHRDHGSSANYLDHSTVPPTWGANVDGWSHPEYDTGDIAGLTNGALLPVVLSVECQCGWFDGEVDQLNDPALTRNAESLCEEFVRRQGGGAVAAIGSARNSNSGYNDDMIRGFIDAIWPSFDPAFSSGGLYSLGQVLTYGKIYMATFNPPPDDATQMTFEEFHLFGDPELSIWTGEPEELDASHPTIIGSHGTQRMVVNVTDHVTGEPVHFAKVCLQKNDEVYSVAYTDPTGGAYLNVNPASGGDMNITATKHNYRPYEGLISVTDLGATITVTPDNGPEGSNPTIQGSSFNGGETVDIYFGGSNPDKTLTASAGAFSDTVTVPDGPVGPINVRAVGRTSGRTAVTVFRRLPDQPLPDPYTYCQWDSSTYHLNPSGGDPRWNNPEITLYEAGTGAQVASNDLEVGTTYAVKVNVHNNANVQATDTEVTLQWADWGMGQRIWNLIGVDMVTVPGLGMATAEANWTPSRTGHTCLMATIHHPFDGNLNNNKGQENTDVHPVSSPGEIEFTIDNPTDTPALMYLDAKQVGGLDLWAAKIEREYPQVQEPGEVKTGKLVVDAPDGADAGEMRVYTVSGYIDGNLVGGIEVYVVVKSSTTISCSVSPSQVTQGSQATVSGSVSPPVDGATVTLLYRNPQGQTFERTATTDTAGSYSYSSPHSELGQWSVTASWRGDSTHMESTSPERVFTVEARKPCQIILAAALLVIAAILAFMRRQGRTWRIIGTMAILIIIILYYWYCGAGT